MSDIENAISSAAESYVSTYYMTHISLVDGNTRFKIQSFFSEFEESENKKAKQAFRPQKNVDLIKYEIVKMVLFIYRILPDE